MLGAGAVGEHLLRPEQYTAGWLCPALRAAGFVSPDAHVFCTAPEVGGEGEGWPGLVLISSFTHDVTAGWNRTQLAG